MKILHNHIALIITELAVKTYILISVIWSKGNVRYNTFRSKTVVSTLTKQPSAA